MNLQHPSQRWMVQIKLKKKNLKRSLKLIIRPSLMEDLTMEVFEKKMAKKIIKKMWGIFVHWCYLNSNYKFSANPKSLYGYGVI